MLIAVSISGNWPVLLSIMPLLCITFVSQSSLHTRKRADFIEAKAHQWGKSDLFWRWISLFDQYIWIILQSSLLRCLYFLSVIYCYGIISGTVSSITDTSMTSPKCGWAATHYLSEGVGLSFFCHPSLKGRYVTIRDLRNGPSGFNLCEVEVYSEQRGMAYLNILKNYY